MRTLRACTACAALLLIANYLLSAPQPRTSGTGLVLQPQQLSPPTPKPHHQLPPLLPSLLPPAKPATVDIIVAADAPLLPGVAGLVRSARAGTSASLHFHVLTPEADEHIARQTLRCLNAMYDDSSWQTTVTIRPLSAAWLNATLISRIRVEADPAVTGKLSSPLNFARFFLPSLLPQGLEQVLYLDADIIVQGDLSALVSRVRLPPRGGGVAVAAVPRHETHFRYSRYAKKCAGIYEARYPLRPAFNASMETFNAGVALIDLVEWTRLNLTDEAIWWMERHARDTRGGLWHLGSQPILHLILHGRWHALPDHWNLDGLGRLSNFAPAALRAANLLHWTGRRKPWLPTGLHTGLYRRFVPEERARLCCSGAACATRKN